MKLKRQPYFVYLPVMAVSLYYSFLGYLIPGIRSSLSVSLAQAGVISSFQSAGIAVSVVLCFCVFSALNKTRVMAAASLLFALCLGAFAFSKTIGTVYVACFFIGIFSNVVDTLSNALIADIAPGQKAFHIGLLQALFSAMGAAAPYLAIVLGGDYPTVLLGLGFFAVAVSVVFLLGLHSQAKMPFLQAKHRIGAAGKLIRTLKIKGVKPIVTAAFFNAFSQISIIFFIASYVGSLTGRAADGAFALCLLFTGCVIGRLIYVRLHARVSTYRIMLIANTMAIAAFIAMLLSRDVLMIGIFACIGGIGFSVNFPGLVVEACGIVSQDTAAATSLIFIGYAAACFIAPPLVGAVGDAFGLDSGLYLSVAMLIPVAIISLWLNKPPARVRSRDIA